MRLREVEEAEKKQMMKERQQKLLEGQLVRSVSVATPPVRWGFPKLYCGGLRWKAAPPTHLIFLERTCSRN